MSNERDPYDDPYYDEAVQRELRDRARLDHDADDDDYAARVEDFYCGSDYPGRTGP